MKYTEGAFQKWGYELVKEEFYVAVGWDEIAEETSVTKSLFRMQSPISPPTD